MNYGAASWITGSWQESVKIRLEQHPFLNINDITRPYDGTCSMCSRVRKLSSHAVLTGNRYSTNYSVEPDFEKCTLNETECGMTDCFDKEGIFFDVGSDCAHRIKKFHKFRHYKYLLYHDVKVELSGYKWSIKKDINNGGKMLKNSKQLKGKFKN